MAIDKDKDFTLTHYLNITAERETLLPQVPFFLGALKHNPPVLRRVLEAILASVCWKVREVNGAFSVANKDVVLLADTSGVKGPCTIALQSIGAACGEGRIIVVKDAGGNASTVPITVSTSGVDTIDGANISFSLNVDYGAVVIIAGTVVGAEWFTIAVV